MNRKNKSQARSLKRGNVVAADDNVTLFFKKLQTKVKQAVKWVLAAHRTEKLT